MELEDLFKVVQEQDRKVDDGKAELKALAKEYVSGEIFTMKLAYTIKAYYKEVGVLVDFETFLDRLGVLQEYHEWRAEHD